VVAVASISLVALPNLQAYSSVSALVYEAQEGGNTEDSVLNTSSLTPQPFDITLLVVSTTSATPLPSTSNSAWIAQFLTSLDWTQAMGGGASTLPTWQQYTGLTFAQAFPGARHGNGYFLSYGYNSGNGDVSFPTNPLFPGDPVLGGFFFQGAPYSTFLIAGPIDATVPTPLGQVQTYEGVPEIIPEPRSLSLCVFALVGAAAFVSRNRRS
jgi:hypothetical protein